MIQPLETLISRFFFRDLGIELWSGEIRVSGDDRPPSASPAPGGGSLAHCDAGVVTTRGAASDSDGNLSQGGVSDRDWEGFFKG